MRRAVILVVTAAAVACGGSSNSKDNHGPSGTIGSRPFAAVEARSVTAASGATACTVPNPLGSGNVQVGIKGLKIDLTSYANVCGDYATAQCKLHADAQSVTIVFAKLNPAPPFGAPAFAPGSYTIQPSPTIALPDGTGLLTVAYAQALRTGAACADAAPSPAVQGGTLRIDQVSDTVVTGGVNITFQDGSTVAGDFSAPACPGVALDVCQLAATQSFCSLPPACL